MAAYAALVSVMHIIEQIQDHPRPPFYLDQKHAQCLIEKIAFLQHFLEVYSHVRNEEVERLESRIAEAAYAAEDLIETHIVDQIHAQTARHGRRICSADFYQDLQKVIEEMDSIKTEVMKMSSVKDFQQHMTSLMPIAGSSRSLPTGQNIMVGCDDVLQCIVDELTRPQRSRRQVVIPIVGMGSIGKTTFAKNVYENQLIVQHFDIRAWATISQEYSVKKILLQLLLCQEDEDSQENLSKQSEVERRDILYKSLFGRRYLIILDDMWSIEEWYEVKSLFPDNNNGSRAIITTRSSKVASDLTGGDKGLEMKFLDDDTGWSLLCKIIFGAEDRCPIQLEKIGRKIAKSCEGLPLAIVVIGGLLAKSEKTPEYWEYIVETSHSLEEKERCLNMLYTSFNHLPVHLKPCFLYMGINTEYCDFDVQTLVSFLVAEGFLKPIGDKSLEEVAAEYLKDIIDRNLILVKKRNHYGEVRSGRIHDLLRDLCLRESKKDKFLFVTWEHRLNNCRLGINTQRLVVIFGSKMENQYNFLQIRDAMQSASVARTLMCDTAKVLSSPKFRLLRVLFNLGSAQGDECPFSNYICELVNLRHLFIEESLVKTLLLSSIYHFWSLQTIISIEWRGKQSFDIWKMPLLRFVAINPLHLRNPGHDDFVLGKLHTLYSVANFRCSEKVVERIPNIKVLGIHYDERFIGSCYCLNNLARLHKLEILSCLFDVDTMPRIELLQNLTLPRNLKELNLVGCGFHWEDISTKIGSLSFLQVLRLGMDAFIGPEWETIEGQFCSLKILKIKNCSDLECWKTDINHFPCLEQLVLRSLYKLEEIPSAIGDISTLRLINLINCSYSAIISAKKIAEEQEELENPDLHVRVQVDREAYEEMKSWARPNFEIVTY